MKKRLNSKNTNYVVLTYVSVALCILFLSIGWAAFQSTFNIKNLYATVRVDRDIRVTGVQAISNTNSGRSNYEEYNVSSIYSTAYLPNQNSTVTYRVEVTNVGNVKAGIYSVGEIYKIINSNIDSDLEIKSTTLVLKETLCDVRSVATFDVVIGYKTNGYDGSHNTHLVTIYFDFRRVFDINYYGFGNTSGLDDEMMDGDTKTITFNSTTGIPANTTTTGATGSYNPTTHILTLSNITVTGLNDTIVVSRHYGITYVDFTGNTNNLPTNIIYTGGTITLGSEVDYPNSVTVNGATGVYNDQTHTIAISNITNDITITATYNTGGSGTWEDPYIDDSPTYDPSTVVAGTTRYDDIDGVPKVTVEEDQNGNTTVTAFQYTDTGTDGVEFGTGQDANSTLDTGVLAFNDDVFSIHIKFKMNLSDNNRAKYVLSALSKTGTNTYSGFSLNIADSNSPTLNLSTYIDKTYNGSRINPTYEKVLTPTSNTEATYEVTMVYNKNSGGQPFVLTCTGSTCSSTSNQNIHKKYIPTNLNDAFVTIGGNGLNTTNDINSLKIVELHICKGTFGTNYSCN